MRQWLVLSTTTAPASTKRGVHSALTDAARRGEDEVEALDRVVAQRSHLDQVEPFHSSRRPAERAEANGTSSETGNSRSASSSRIVVPTSPVAPSTPTL